MHGTLYTRVLTVTDWIQRSPSRLPGCRLLQLLIPAAALLLAVPGCGQATGPDGLAPVSATKPSADDRILAAPEGMSDGSAMPRHIVETIDTGLAMFSRGGVGGVTVDNDGNVYSTNFLTHVWKITPAGELTVFSDAFVNASGNLALDDGSLLQADYRDNAIYRLDADGKREVFSGEGLDGPVGIVRNLDGSFVVANYRGAYLARVPANGGAAVELLRDPRMTHPNGVTIDPEGNIYIADLESGIVFRRTPDGKLLELVTLPGKGNAHNVYANGALYVNKIWDHVIYRVDTDTGAYGIVAGNGRPGYDDGPTGIATIEEPNGIAVAPDGSTIWFNTHKGAMILDEPGAVILRRVVIDD